VSANNHTAQFALCQAVAALLAELPALGSGAVRVARRRPMPQAVASQVFVFYDESQPTAMRTNESIVWKTRVRIECVARDVAGIAADDAADALVQSSYERVMATPLLGGLATATEPVGIANTFDEADTALAAGQLLFDITHRCARTSIA
jgi:hypothetical protein